MLAPDFGCEFLFGIEGMHSDAALLNAIRSSHLFVASDGGLDTSDSSESASQIKTARRVNDSML